MPNLLTMCGRTLAVALLLAGGLAGQERREVPPFRTYGVPASTADADAIQAFIEEYLGAWGRQDADALARLHAEDTEWINAYARMFRGAAPLAEFLRTRLFPEFDPAVAAEEAGNMTLVSVRYLGADAAVIHLYTDGRRGPSRNPGESLRRTHLHLVLEKQEPGWRIVHTAIMDAR